MSEVIRDYEFHAAGDVWVVPEYHLSTLPDGTTGVSMTEFERIHRVIAWELCRYDSVWGDEAVEFLCDIAGEAPSTCCVVDTYPPIYKGVGKFFREKLFGNPPTAPPDAGTIHRKVGSTPS